MPIDNELYNQLADTWWNENKVLYFLRAGVNPGRFGYFRDVLTKKLRLDPKGKQTLDIGCGGGLLAEEFAQLGCKVTGVDPSAPSIAAAQAHAQQVGLHLTYQVASAEQLPFADESFDIVYCCDVLEHVRNLEKTISETARVLKPGGIYFYDTVNRTFLSKLLVIKVLQEWPWTRIMPPNLHEWNKFIKPGELHILMARYQIESREYVGLTPSGSPLKIITILCKLNRGEMSYAEGGRQVTMKVSKNTSTSYAGYGIKVSSSRGR